MQREPRHRFGGAHRLSPMVETQAGFVSETSR
jgi:hypothetical protein